MQNMPNANETGKQNGMAFPLMILENRYAAGTLTAHSINKLTVVVYLTRPVPFTMQEIPLNTAYIH